jgi:hypothetical protein
MNAPTEIQDTQSSQGFFGLLLMSCASAFLILGAAVLTSWLQGPTGTILDDFLLLSYLGGVPLVAILGLVLSRYGWFEVGVATMAGAALSTFILVMNDPFGSLAFVIAIILQIPGLLAGLVIGGVLRAACRGKTGLAPGSIERLRSMVLLGGAVIALTAIVLAGIHSTEILEALFPPPPTGK